jgi:hypothetical protein
MKKRWIFIVIACLTAVVAWWMWSRARLATSADSLLLLVPDSTSLSDPRVVLWGDAGSEEGLHVVPTHDSEFLRTFLQRREFAGLIVPDSIHREASDVVVAELRRFVSNGGKLMLVYDAATLSREGRYAPNQSRLSDIVGVKYALYDALREETIQWANVKGQTEIFDELGVPPGKYYPLRPASESMNDASYKEKAEAQITRYLYGDLKYPSFVTKGDYSGQLLLHSSAGLVAGERRYNAGSVLFVNLPLGYLKANTDGLLLHSFLRYFAEHLLSLPRLLPVPDGIGGLVLNWHIDSNAAIKPLKAMQKWTILQQGPYSVHITAGPDAMNFGDGRGFNVEHNAASQALINEYKRLGYSIGSHGGWIHDYFAAHVDNGNPKDLAQFLSLNKSALEQTTGEQVVEYSAPAGNQPVWVTQWLESHGFVGYYFTGDTGMAPTQGYRNGKRAGENIWAFPILHLNRAAAFEEFGEDDYSQPEVQHWLDGITQFAADHRSVRLLYFHPPGILNYEPVIERWLQKTARLKKEKQFRWYTIAGLATFLNSRKQVSWKVERHNQDLTIVATHPSSLEHVTWSFPSSAFAEPKIVEGTGTVTKANAEWLVIAGTTKNLRVHVGMLDLRTLSQ